MDIPSLLVNRGVFGVIGGLTNKLDCTHNPESKMFPGMKN